jgi:hypothetical protein
MNLDSIEKHADEVYASIKAYVKGVEKETFLGMERDLRPKIFELACILLQLYIAQISEKLDLTDYIKNGDYRKKPLAKKVLKTTFGEVEYLRTYLQKKHGSGGFCPLDVVLGVFADGFSPFMISLVTRTTTRLSFSASTLILKWFLGRSPSVEAAEGLVLGLGRKAGEYMETYSPPEGDGEILVIEIDGKATPTATEQELEKRRGKRCQSGVSCNCEAKCQRHRGQSKRNGKKKARKKKGDKSKNGRSITLVAMYTLKRGADGKMHGPINKKIWGSYNTRKVMMQWAKRHALLRAFSLGSKNIQIVMDGEVCLAKGLKEIFTEARFTLDIRHLEEYLWELGRHYHKEGSEELAEWVSKHKQYLYEGCEKKLLEKLKGYWRKLSKRTKKDSGKVGGLAKMISYMEPRLSMMDYKDIIENDLVLGSGVIEGAARYVVGERMDCSGMRWTMGRAEALLHLRCIELNGDWESFYESFYQNSLTELKKLKPVKVRSTCPIPIDKEESS